MLKLLAVAVLGYFTYRHFNDRKSGPAAVPLAGGPLSENATLRHSPDLPTT